MCIRDSSHVAVQQNEVKPDGLLVLDRFRPLMRTVHKQVQVRPRFATFGDAKKHGILELPPLMQDFHGDKLFPPSVQASTLL